MKSYHVFIPGTIPAKKNGKFLARGRTITNPAVQAELQQITLRMVMERTKQRIYSPFSLFSISVQYFVSYLGTTDPDNAMTSILDCLRDAAVIENDNPKCARRQHCEVIECAKGGEGALVSIEAYVI